MKQKSATRIGIIGSGGIGQYLKERLIREGYSVTFIASRKKVVTKDETFKGSFTSYAEIAQCIPKNSVDIVCLAIPTLDTGESALQYITDITSQKIAVVTCEKGALSYHADALSSVLKSQKLFAYSASVGGGTQLLPYLTSRNLRDRIVSMEAVINGTCNFIFHQIALGGRTLGEACDEAIRLGYAEPGAKDPLSLINGELKDVRMKTCVLFNTVLAGSIFITPRDLGALSLQATDMETLSRNAAQSRLVITFSNHEQPEQLTHRGSSFTTNVDGWNIQGGFRDVSIDPDLASWLPAGVGNALHLVEGKLGSGGRYLLSGPGAGYEPTTSAMINDIETIRIHL